MNNVEAIKQLEKMKGLRSLLPESKKAIDVAIDSLHTQWQVKKQVEDDQRKVEADAHKDDMLRILFNRCRTIAPLCMFCSFRKECEEYRSVLKGE